VIFVIQKVILSGAEENRRKKVFIFAVVTLVITGSMLCLFVTNTHIPPYWDQAQVYLDALSFKNGDFEDMDGYLGMYPQQYGLIFLYELIFCFTKDSYIVLEYLNVLFILLIIFFCYRLCEELFHDQTANFYCILGGVLFLPMHIYVNFVYGDLVSTAFSIIGIWAVLRWKHTEKWWYAVLALFAFVIAYLSRKNVLILLIAVFLALLIEAFRDWNWKAVVIALLLLTVPIACMSGVKLSYEWRSGKEVEKGIPSIMWIAMGMQGDQYGPGMFNGYTESTFRGEAESDSEKGIQIAKEEIRNRLEEFAADRDKAVDFYKAKIQLQWIDPTFSSFVMTSKFGEDPTPYTLSFYYGKVPERILKFMNNYSFIIYVSVCIYAVLSLIKKQSILYSMGLIAVIGGFLFSIIWEAKGRYVMPYVILMIPYMAKGLHGAQMLLEDGVRKILNMASKSEI